MDNEIGERLLRQILDLWILPELRRRVDEGIVESNYRVFKAQVIFSFDQRFPKVRLNDQIKAIGKARLNRSITKGEAFCHHEVEDIESLGLTKDDPNCGHITMVLIKNSWKIFFDFRYNKGHVRERLSAAREHLDTAHEAMAQGRIRSFYEICFAASEALTEAILIPHSNKARYKDHDTRERDLYSWAELGNVSMDYPITLDKLRKQIRPAARYFASTAHQYENPNYYIEVLEDMYDFAKRIIE